MCAHYRCTQPSAFNALALRPEPGPQGLCLGACVPRGPGWPGCALPVSWTRHSDPTTHRAEDTRPFSLPEN